LTSPNVSHAEKITVRLVRAALGYDIEHATCGATELRHVITLDDLEFLDGLLRDGRPDAVHRVVQGVDTVHGNFIGAGEGIIPEDESKAKLKSCLNSQNTGVGDID
jgi:hypothetical protein